MPLITFIAAASFSCFTPAHRDGESVRCGDRAPVMRLYGIMAPPSNASCNNNFNCSDDPATLARDHLAELTRGQQIFCTAVGKAKHSPVRTVRCTVNRVDVSCVMVADGFADKIDKALDCPAPPPVSRRGILPTSFIEMPPLWRWIPLYLMGINIVTYLAFAADKSRAQRALNRVSEVHLLTLVVFGGGIGALIAQYRLDHMRGEQTFANRSAIILGLLIGALIGVIGLALLS